MPIRIFRTETKRGVVGTWRPSESEIAVKDKDVPKVWFPSMGKMAGYGLV